RGTDDVGDDAAADRESDHGQEPAGEHRANNADDDVADQTKAVTGHDRSGQPARDRPDHQPNDDINQHCPLSSGFYSRVRARHCAQSYDGSDTRGASIHSLFTAFGKRVGGARPMQEARAWRKDWRDAGAPAMGGVPGPPRLVAVHATVAEIEARYSVRKAGAPVGLPSPLPARGEGAITPAATRG